MCRRRGIAHDHLRGEPRAARLTDGDGPRLRLRERSGCRNGTPRLLPAIDRVVVRDVADGSGPSHLIPLDAYLLVVDPWAASIRRYRLSDLHAAPTTCTYPRWFAPWRTVRIAAGVRLIGEPYEPDGDGGYHLRSTARR